MRKHLSYLIYLINIELSDILNILGKFVSFKKFVHIKLNLLSYLSPKYSYNILITGGSVLFILIIYIFSLARDVSNERVLLIHPLV